MARLNGKPLKITTMKKIVIILAAAFAAFSTASCTKEEPVSSVVEINGELKVNITVGNPGVETKAVKTGWAVGDKLNLWYDTNKDNGNPDLIVKFNGTKWVKDTEATLSGKTPSAASGTLKVVYEASNNWKDTFNHTYSDYPTAATNKRVQSIYAYATPMVIYSVTTYSVASNELSATITDWTYATPVQIVVTGLNPADAANYALGVTALASVKGINMRTSEISVYQGSNRNSQLGVANTDGVAFYFMPDPQSVPSTSSFVINLWDLANKNLKSVTIDGSITYDIKKCQSIKIKAEKFTTVKGFGLDGLSYSISDGKATLTRSDMYQDANHYKGDIVVPSSVTFEGKTYPVKVIGNEAFKNCSELTSVTLSEGIEELYPYAFESTPLTKLNLPASLNYINTENSVFNGSPNLEITVAEGNQKFFLENKILYGKYGNYYQVYHVPETMGGDIVLNEKTVIICSNGTLYNTAADSIEFPAGFSNGTWGQFKGNIKDGLVLKFNYTTYEAFTKAFTTSIYTYRFGMDTNCKKIVMSFPATMSDADFASIQAWFGTYAKEVVRRN